MTTAEQVVSQLGNITVTKGTFTCEYCKKSFQKETFFVQQALIEQKNCLLEKCTRS